MATPGRTQRPVRPPLPKPLRVLIGLSVMLLLVGSGFLVLSMKAGEWGVPYFEFETAGGSTCTNQWAGYTCEELSDSDFEEYSGFTLPAGTTLEKVSYTRTHDYSLHAELRTTKEKAAEALQKVTEAYGECQPTGAPPQELAGYTELCLVNSEYQRGTQTTPLAQRWFVASGLAPDGSRLTVLEISSR
ncbi:hypothetical protein ACQBAU_10925 [Propionibacteriaceae bacterium Y2011]|uniref:hypothetical protein n=1 Tax=Microlunatus sp. Y2014 TaxID=3418488 RepID=UPI003B484915